MGQVCENCGWRTKDGECIFTNPKTKRLWKKDAYNDPCENYIMDITLRKHIKSILNTPSTSMCYDPNFIKYFRDTVRWFEIARYLHKQYKLSFKFTYPQEYLRLVRMTGKTPYYNPYKTVVNDSFIKYYLPQFCSQTVYEDLYYKAFSYALDCLVL